MLIRLENNRLVIDCSVQEVLEMQQTQAKASSHALTYGHSVSNSAPAVFQMDGKNIPVALHFLVQEKPS